MAQELAVSEARAKVAAQARAASATSTDADQDGDTAIPSAKSHAAKLKNQILQLNSFVEASDSIFMGLGFSVLTDQHQATRGQSSGRSEDQVGWHRRELKLYY